MDGGSAFYWQSSLAELNAITGVTNADKAIVMDANHAVTFYDHLSGAWAVAGSTYVDVRAHEAAGDGVTDDTAAIQAAIDSITNGQGTVFLPAGTYAISSAIQLVERIKLKGAGIRATTIKALNNMSSMIKFPATVGLQSDCELSDMLINGNNKTGITIDVNGNAYAKIHDLSVANMTTGIELAKAGAYWNSIERVKFQGTFTNGIRFDNQVNSTLIADCDWGGTITYPIKVESTFNGDTIRVRGGSMDTSSTTNNILLSPLSSYQGLTITVDGLRIDGSTSGANIDIGQNVQATIINSSIASASTNHMSIDGANCRVESNYHSASVGAAIALTTNSNGNIIGPAKWNTGTEQCASKVSDAGTGNYMTGTFATDNNVAPLMQGHMAIKTDNTVHFGVCATSAACWKQISN